MSFSLAAALYVIIWWVVLFAVLPFGVHSQAENDEVTHGTEPGAPTAPRLLVKVFATTMIAAAVLAVVIAAYNFVEL